MFTCLQLCINSEQGKISRKYKKKKIKSELRSMECAHLTAKYSPIWKVKIVPTSFCLLKQGHGTQDQHVRDIPFGRKLSTWLGHFQVCAQNWGPLPGLATLCVWGREKVVLGTKGHFYKLRAWFKKSDLFKIRLFISCLWKRTGRRLRLIPIHRLTLQMVTMPGLKPS